MEQAIIFDRDGTTFSVEHHKDKDTGDIRCWHCYNGLAAFDAPIPEVVNFMRLLAPFYTILMTSGREEFVRPAFVAGLRKHQVPVDHLFMRRNRDTRRDAVVKLEMYHEKIEPFYDVKLVVDDRPPVVDAWRSVGLHVVQVTDPGILPGLCLQE